jgi:hypothetical protein
VVYVLELMVLDGVDERREVSEYLQYVFGPRQPLGYAAGEE